ncbi:Na+/H+ antiporter [Bacillus sp. EB600]|uniref:Na+/H+ antiporter n=1 Tax=Bacillus sp. EB600 TaxID=2806345 RepID=UPI00210A69E6|nr:Na+/H+ antiporter [Bacillus sp. EB600]MCQ6280464.1 Na+/H+ antiporter [Bacillus sp. EB600]
MELFLAVLLLLAIIGLSNIINHFIPFIPVPLIQIGLGVSLAALPLGIQIQMEPELFFVLFIAPLLFNDGKNVSRAALWKFRKQILMLALGLVFLTVITIGYFIYWIIPAIPLPAAFALAAILSPTDVVAVSAISSRVNMPKDIMHLLEGEGLMNDASGLVAFNFAVAATVTGAFSLTEASLSFLAIAIGGFIGGAIVAFIIIRFRVFIRRLGIEDVTIHMVIQILTPFVIFLLIEHFHLSGILAVVAAGIVHSIGQDHKQRPTGNLEIVSKNTWSVILYILNGLVFVVLGLQIPRVLSQIFKDPLFNNLEVTMYILLITSALLLLRFVWISITWWSSWKLKLNKFTKPSLREIGITTLSGVRGAVTLAGAFSIPFVLANGDPFPERPLIIFIAAGIILVTLAGASIFLPIIAKPNVVGVENNKEEMEKTAYNRSQEAAIWAIREVMNENNREAALSVISTYNHRINQARYKGNEQDSHRLKKEETEIRLKALEAESQYITYLIKEKRIEREIAYLALEYIRRMEIAVTNQMRYRGMVIWTLFKRSMLRTTQIFNPNKQELRKKRRIKQKKLIQLKIEMAEAAIKVLKGGIVPTNKHISYLVIGEYNKLITGIKLVKNTKGTKVFSRLKRELQDKAFQVERDEVQNLYEKGNITIDVARKLRTQINIREAYWMEENSLPYIERHRFS